VLLHPAVVLVYTADVKWRSETKAAAIRRHSGSNDNNNSNSNNSNNNGMALSNYVLFASALGLSLFFGLAGVLIVADVSWIAGVSMLVLGSVAMYVRFLAHTFALNGKKRSSRNARVVHSELTSTE
jgi:lysylphosphatidylglycerol synthetase-like protein (DUF2156 family)